MIASDVITLSREALNDTERDYRFEDAELLRALDEACQELKLDRPDLLLTSTGTYGTVDTVDALGDTLAYDVTYRNALANKVCHKIYVKDSEDDGNARLAQDHLQLYKLAI